MFASALTLMLRSQGIPARIVIGFYGGDTNPLTDSIMIRGYHAHAWVEAYLRPEDCTPAMIDAGLASHGGAWLRLDPTPPTSTINVGVGTEAIEFARAMWQEYVLGMSANSTTYENTGYSSPLMDLIDRLQIDRWSSQFMEMDDALQSGQFRSILVLLIIFPPLLTWLATVLLNYQSIRRGERPKRWIRNFFANAVSFFSPRLGKWILGNEREFRISAPFYDRLIAVLKTKGLERSSIQSQRDFALRVSQEFADHPRAAMISSVVQEISEIYNQVRFGQQTVPTDLLEQIEICLDDLESTLESSL